MDLKRKDYKDKINTEIYTLQKSIELDINMLENLKQQGATSFVKSQITKISDKNNERQTMIDNLYDKIKAVDNGELDQEIISLNLCSTNRHRDEQKAVLQKRRERVEQKKVEYKVSHTYYREMYQADRKQKNQVKDIDRGFLYFQRTCNSVPDYIKRNLKEMPNNKGYIWKGIWCLGELPEENNKFITLFEKQRGGLLIIHEISKYEYKIFHKNGRDRKVLFSVEQRKKISC